MPNQVFETIRTVLAVRDFDGRPLPREVLDRIVEAARLSASAANRQPWHFVVVEDHQALDELANLVKSGPYIAGAAAAIVVAYDRSSRFALSDASRAIQSMVLAAWADGVGSNWTGFDNLPDVGALVGLPDPYQVLAVVPFGYPARTLGRGKKARRPVGDVVSLGRFGTPYQP